jgi:hypothetical protein
MDAGFGHWHLIEGESPGPWDPDDGGESETIAERIHAELAEPEAEPFPEPPAAVHSRIDRERAAHLEALGDYRAASRLHQRAQDRDDSHRR